MGRKLHWFKMWSDQYLADEKLRRISLPAHGAYNLCLNLLRTQVDRPGFFVIRGKPLTVREIASLLSLYHLNTKTRFDVRIMWVSELLDVGLLRESDTGVIYSPRIVEELETSEAAQIGGRVRAGAIGDRAGDRFGDLEVEENKSEPNRKPKEPYSGTPIDRLPVRVY
jgi:hypothetical protein